MIGLDTNVVIRILTRDDEEQYRQALALVRNEHTTDGPALISLVVLQETEWVLRSRYGFGKDTIVEAIRALLELPEIVFEDDAVVEEAVFNWRMLPCEFSDCLIAARNRTLGCEKTMTFDTQATRHSDFKLV